MPCLTATPDKPDAGQQQRSAQPKAPGSVAPIAITRTPTRRRIRSSGGRASCARLSRWARGEPERGCAQLRLDQGRDDVTVSGLRIFPRRCRIREAKFDNTVTAETPPWEDDMKYIALLYGEPDAGPVPGTPEFMQMLGEFQSATTAMAEAGVLVDSGPLQPPQTATTVRVRDGQAQLSDGPFAEIKEQLGGYYILDCADLDTALRYAAMIPSAKYGSVEVRPVMVMGPH